jgi:molybdate transport system substrate-binding protein
MSDRSSRGTEAESSGAILDRDATARARTGAGRAGVGRRFGVLCVSVLLCLSCSRSEPQKQAGAANAPAEPIKVAAAADLAKAFEEVASAFEKKNGVPVKLTFGSTGLLAKQIQEGAPFDVFAAANISFVDDVVRAGQCFEDSKTLYARGRIVVWTKDDGLEKKIEDLEDPRLSKIAMANPEHAPYGRAAQQALAKLRLWDTVKPRMVYGENVQQTLQFAQSGNADVAIVALSLAVVSGGKYTMIDPELHAPLDQALVVCKGGGKVGASARKFTAFVGAPEGREIMKRYGFLLPGESVARDGR